MPAGSHPLGVLAEYRVLAWNFPSGNEDIVYLIVTFYNITSTNPADYAQHRPAMRDLLLTQAEKFQADNNAKFGITLPTGGYTIGPMYAAFAADMDVGDASNNFVSVNLPFAMGYSYQTDFMTAPAWVFDPGIFGPPFFAGVGFVGTKYLKGPTGAGAIQLFSGNVNGGNGFPDPQTGIQLFRYLSGDLIPGIDRPCNYIGIPAETHICYLQKTTGTDTRHFQSSPAMTVAPGESKSIVIAYLFAPPVALVGYTPSSSNQIDPGDPGWTAHPDSMLLHMGPTGKPGLNRIDSTDRLPGVQGPDRPQCRWQRIPAGPVRLRGRAEVTARQGAGCPAGVRRSLPAPVRPGPTGLLPDPRRQGSDGHLEAITERPGNARIDG